MSQNKCKVATCACGQVFFASQLPDAETDADTCREFRKYAKQGYGIKYVDSSEVRANWIKPDHDASKCVKSHQSQQLSLI